MHKVMIVDNEQIRFEAVRKVKDGMIYTWKRHTYAAVDGQKYYSGKCIYYVIGGIDSEAMAHLDYAANLFKSRFFRSLTRDKFSLTEIILLAAMAFNMFLTFQMQNKLGEFLELLAI